MEIEIMETTIISPPITSNHLPILSLSHIDNDPNLNVTVRTLRFYNFISGDPGSIIADGLSKALVYYYPLAGALRRRSSDSRLEVCTANGGGVQLVRASSTLTLDALLEYRPGDPILDKFAPDPINGDELAHPLWLQVTRLACGGFTLGMSVHHSLCDGAGATQFLSTLAALARATSPIESPQPVWDRDVLLGPRAPPLVSILRTFQVDTDPDILHDLTTPMVRECFHVSNSIMNRFRTGLKSTGSAFTSFEAMSAFIWVAKVKAAGVAPEARVKFVYYISIKKVLNPPLPNGYWGNTIIPVYVQLTAEELLRQPVSRTAELIKESKMSVNDEYVRSYIDFQELHYGKGATEVEGVSAFTDWRHLGHSEVDFGSGGPIAVWPMSWKLMGSVEPCFFLPCATTKGEQKDGFRVLISLRKDALEAFRLEMEIFREPVLPEGQMMPQVPKLSHI